MIILLFDLTFIGYAKLLFAVYCSLIFASWSLLKIPPNPSATGGQALWQRGELKISPNPSLKKRGINLPLPRRGIEGDLLEGTGLQIAASRLGE